MVKSLSRLSGVVMKNEVILTQIPNNIAKTRLDIGPARLTPNIPLLLSLKYAGFTGTGLAHPKQPVTIITNIPIESMWTIGFKVILPMSLAVGSPILYAT